MISIVLFVFNVTTTDHIVHALEAGNLFGLDSYQSFTRVLTDEELRIELYFGRGGQTQFAAKKHFRQATIWLIGEYGDHAGSEVVPSTISLEGVVDENTSVTTVTRLVVVIRLNQAEVRYGR